MVKNLKVLEIAFVLKLVSREELLDWSDKNIMLDYSDQIFIELSSITKNDKDSRIIDVLKANSVPLNRKDFEKLTTVVLSYLSMEIENWEKVQKKLVLYYSLIEDCFFEESEFWSRLKDDYYLRQDGYSGCMRMPKELKQFFDSLSIKIYQDSFLNVILNAFSMD